MAAVKILHYVAPLVSFAYFALASLWSTCALHHLKGHFRHKLHLFILGTTLYIVLHYALEAAAINAQLFYGHLLFTSHHENVYVLAEFLLWLTMFLSIKGHKIRSWYPYYGTWALTAVFDLTITVISGQAFSYKTLLELLQVIFHACRLFPVVFLLILYFGLRVSKNGGDEETTPLLGPGESRLSARRDNRTSYSSVRSGESLVAAELEEEVAKEEREEQEKMERHRERLQEKGNWFTYIKSFSIFLPLVWPVKKPLLQLNVALVAVCVLALRGLNVLVPFQLGLLTNNLADGLAKESFLALIYYMILVWLDSYAGIQGLRKCLWIPVESNASAKIETASYNHIMELSCDFHDQKENGELYTSMGQGQSVVNLLDALLFQLGPLMVDIAVACIYFYFLFDEYLVLIGVAVMVLNFQLAVSLSTGQTNIRRQLNVTRRRKTQVMHDSIGGWRTVAYFNRIPHAQRVYDAAVCLFRQWDQKCDLSWHLRFGVQSLALDICCVVAYFYGAYGVVYGNKSVGTFVTLMIYWNGFTWQLRSLAQVQKSLMRALVDAEELLLLFQSQPNVQDGPNEFAFHAGHVKVDRVCFSYSNGNEIIKDLTFHARPGQTVALIGETGAGKSTILKLLFRFYDVTSGSISIDGQDLRNVTLRSFRDYIGVVPQDPVLFNNTIMANVRYARLEATDDEVKEACKAAAIHDKIMTFNNDYGTKVGERGVKLSGGELQRVAIARAILKDSKIILLDEATSSVDSETEAKIQEALTRLSRGRTTFVVAHRLSTVQKADRIFVIKDGSIAEQGTPRQLLNSKGRYYSLWTKQMGLVDSFTQGDENAPPLPESTQVSNSLTKFRAEGQPQISSNKPPVHPKSDQKIGKSKRSISQTSIEECQDGPTGKGKLKKRNRGKSVNASANIRQAMQKEEGTTGDTGNVPGNGKASHTGAFKGKAQGVNKIGNDQPFKHEASSLAEPHGEEKTGLLGEHEVLTTSLEQHDRTNSDLVGDTKSHAISSDQNAENSEKQPLTKAVRSIIHSHSPATRQMGDLQSLASIEETEEEASKAKSPRMKDVVFSETANGTNSLTTRIDQVANENSAEIKFFTAPAADDSKSEVKNKPHEARDELLVTGKPAGDPQVADADVAKAPPDKRTFSGRKRFRPRPDAPEFVPKSKKRGGIHSQSTESESSCQAASQEFDGLLVQSGNIRRDALARRLQVKSDPTGQSLKKIQDEWIAGLGENIATPEDHEISELNRAATGIGGHVVSRSTPFGGNRRRNRSGWKKRGSSNESDGSFASAAGPSVVAPTPPVLTAPNTTPTGLLTPAGEAPH